MLIKLEHLECRELVDTGTVMDVQDPALYFTLGQLQFNTLRAHNAGVQAVFPESYEYEIDATAYNEGKLELEVEVLNRGPTEKKSIHIGKGKIILKNAIPKFNEFVDFSISLVHSKANGTSLAKGVVSIRGIVYDDPAKSPSKSEKVLDSAAVKNIAEDVKEDVLANLFGDVGDLKEDFHCAYQTKFIRHGRLYVTSRYICFYSKLFGRETKIRIPFDHIQTITKVPDKFGGVLHAVLIDAGDKTYKFHSFWDVEHALKLMNSCFEDYHQRPRSDTATTNSNVDEVDEVAPQTSELDDASAPEQFQLEATKCKYKNPVLAEQPLPVSVAAFYSLFIEDTAPHSYKLYHESVKDTNVIVTNWSETGPNEFSREIKFFKPVNLPGLASTRGVKLQRLKRFGTAGLILSSSTRLEDVPAADTFSVDDTLSIKATGPHSVAVEITFQVTFIKSTFLRAMIESPTNREMKNWLNAFFESLKAKCAAHAGGVAKGEAATSTSSPTPTQATTTTSTPAPAPAPVTAVEAAPAGGGGGLQGMLNGALPLLCFIVIILLYLQVRATNNKLDRLEQLLAEFLKEAATNNNKK